MDAPRKMILACAATVLILSACHATGQTHEDSVCECQTPNCPRPATGDDSRSSGTDASSVESERQTDGGGESDARKSAIRLIGYFEVEPGAAMPPASDPGLVDDFTFEDLPNRPYPLATGRSRASFVVFPIDCRVVEDNFSVIQLLPAADQEVPTGIGHGQQSTRENPVVAEEFEFSNLPAPGSPSTSPTIVADASFVIPGNWQRRASSDIRPVDSSGSVRMR